MKFKARAPVTGGKDFVSLKDKESIVGVFMGEIHEYYAQWSAADRRYVEVPPETRGAKFRFRVNLVIKEGAAYVPKIFEQGATVYNDLATLNETYPLEKTLVKITRHGSAMSDTSYNLLPMPQGIPPETLKHLATIKLHDVLNGSAKDEFNVPSDEPPPMPSEDDEIPF